MPYIPPPSDTEPQRNSENRLLQPEPYLGEENKDLELGNIDFGQGSLDDSLNPGQQQEVCFICQYPQRDHDPSRQGSFTMAMLDSNDKNQLIRTDSEQLLQAAAGDDISHLERKSSLQKAALLQQQIARTTARIVEQHRSKSNSFEKHDSSDKEPVYCIICYTNELADTA